MAPVDRLTAPVRRAEGPAAGRPPPLPVARPAARSGHGRHRRRVDGSANAAAALRWAHREAGLRRDQVVALFAWGFVPPGHAGDGHTFDVDDGASQAQFALQAAVVDALGPEAARAVDARTVCGPAVEELRLAAKAADMLVVGTRGIGRVHGLLIGSVCHQLLHEAPVPLAVVPAPAGSSTGLHTVAADPRDPGRIVAAARDLAPCLVCLATRGRSRAAAVLGRC